MLGMNPYSTLSHIKRTTTGVRLLWSYFHLLIFFHVKENFKSLSINLKIKHCFPYYKPQTFASYSFFLDKVKSVGRRRLIESLWFTMPCFCILQYIVLNEASRQASKPWLPQGLHLDPSENKIKILKGQKTLLFVFFSKRLIDVKWTK